MLFMWEDGYTKKMEFGQIVCGLHHNGQRPIKCFITKNAINNSRVRGDRITLYLIKIQKSLDKEKGKLYCYLEPYNDF